MTNTTKQVEQELSDAELELAVGGIELQQASMPVGIAASPGEPALIQSADANADMMKLQMAMQRENMVFTSVSNVLKTKHDTTNNSISNIR